MPASRITLSIPSEEFVRLYSGTAKFVVARAEDGRTVRFDANHLRPFVTGNGVRGRFEIEYGPDNKFLSIRRLN